MAAVVYDEEASEGLAALLGGLIESAAADPAKSRVLDAMNGTVTIAAPDAEVEVGLRFANGVCRVHGTGIPGSKVRIEMPSETLMGFSMIPLMFGMPSVRTPEGRAFTRQVLSREVRISGLWHLRLVTQLNTLLSLV